MKWFKFYGKDWLTDMKIMKMSIEDRLCFITLLCLADDDDNPGIIKDCDEEAIIGLTHLYQDPTDNDNEFTRAKGFLKRLNDNKMITINNDNKVIIINFEKRQSKNLSGYERIKRYREKQKAITEAKNSIDNKDNDKITPVITPIRVEKKRVDKSRKEKKLITKVINYSSKSLELAKLLFDLIKENNPSWNANPNFDKWAEDIDKINRIDKRTFEQIELMIRWCQKDDFWHQNILSPSKLRKQFNQLVVKAGSQGKEVAVI